MVLSEHARLENTDLSTSGGKSNAEMSGPPNRPGIFLSGMSWFSEVEAEGRLISREWKAWRQASKIKNRQTPGPLAAQSRRAVSLTALTLTIATDKASSATPDQLTNSFFRI